MNESSQKQDHPALRKQNNSMVSPKHSYCGLTVPSRTLLTFYFHCEAVRGAGDGLCDWVVMTEPFLDPWATESSWE